MPPRRKTNDSLVEPSGEPTPITELDPILPLPAHTGIPPVKQDEGESILSDTRMMVVELPYRAFYMLWEHAEKRAADQYPLYKSRVDGMERQAARVMEAVHGFRSAFRGEILPILSETEAQAIRDKAAAKIKKAKDDAKAAKQAEKDAQQGVPKLGLDPSVCPNCEGSGLKKKTKDGSKVFKCASCGFKWPRTSPALAPQSRSKPRKRGSGSPSASKPASGKSRPRKRPSKKG